MGARHAGAGRRHPGAGARTAPARRPTSRRGQEPAAARSIQRDCRHAAVGAVHASSGRRTRHGLPGRTCVVVRWRDLDRPDGDRRDHRCHAGHRRAKRPSGSSRRARVAGHQSHRQPSRGKIPCWVGRTSSHEPSRRARRLVQAAGRLPRAARVGTGRVPATRPSRNCPSLFALHVVRRARQLLSSVTHGAPPPPNRRLTDRSTWRECTILCLPAHPFGPAE
jgi:hypothetical protein